MRKDRIAKAIASMIPLLCVTIFNSCDSWMKDDDFFSSVEEEVRVANAEKLNVFVRCAATKMGTTIPNGYAVFKQDVVSSVSMVPETDYGFWKWAAFSTDFFDPNKQHTSLYCQNPESYAESFAPFELDPAVVTFENPNSEITNVTIHANRNDVVLVPVCVERPMLTVSIPGSGEANVVRNMSIRLLFSKPMDPKSFYDEETGASNFTFLQGRATITESSDVSLTDISDYFESPIFSMGGKLITFKLKSDKLFNANGQITVRYTGEVKDIYGYNVASGSSFQFRVGTAVDSSSPGIDVLTFGVEGKYNTFKDIYSKFRSEANVASVKGVSDELCATSLDDPAFDTIATYRTKSNIVDIYVHGIEYKGSSKNKVNASGDESESDIVIIGTRSCLVYNKDGTPTGANIAEEKVAEIDYAAGVSYSKDIPESEFNETTGTLFSYDITDYPDGLIRIDVALADSVGNFGFDDNCTNPENDNGYKSVFIVKDTSAPDAVAIKDAIQSDSKSAIYQWYNEKTLGTIRFKDMEKDNPIAGIVDSGHFHLRSAKKDMKWIFHSGAENDEWAPSENDAGWKNVSESYDLKNAVLQGSDEYVPISVAFMDDLGHISPVVGITAIKYDNTKPVVDSYMWVDSSNAEARNNTKLDVLDIDKQLKVAFTESLSGSGVRRIALKITKDANVVDGLAHSVKVYYSASDEVPSGTELALVPVEDVTDSSYKFYEIPSALTSGYLFFRGIPIAAVDGKYDVSVSLIDQALNESSASSPIAMFKDTTPPSVNQATVSVDNIVVRPGDNTQWLKRDAYNSNSVSFTVNETGSGIEFIVLTGTIEITDATTVTVNGVPAADVSLEVASNRIKFTNFKNPSIFGSSVSVKISGIKFKDRDSESGNTVSFRIVDFASTESFVEYGYKVYADSAAPVVASVTLHDADSTTEWTAGTTNYRDIYTNSDTVNATVVFADAEKGTNSCSGVRVLTVTGATITGATVSTEETTCTVSGSTVTFTPPLKTGSETVSLTGVKLAAGSNSERTINAYATDFAEWTGDAVSSQKIVLDTLTPEVTEISWTAVASDSDLVPGITGEKVVADQKLNVTLGTTASGVKTVSVAVTIEGTQRSDSLKNEKLTVYFDGTELTKTTDYSVSGNTLTFTTPRQSGVVSFKGLTIDDQDRDGSYAIDVSLKTAAENENNAASHYSISRDSVTPEISKVVIPPVTVGENQIPVIESVIPYGTDGTGTTPVYFAGAQAGFDYKTGKNSFTLDLYITEQTSGVQQITFESGCNVRLSSESTLSVIHSGSTKDLVKGTDYTVDGTGKVITFLDSGDPVVKDESPEFVLSMTNCNFENVKYMDHESASDENRFSFTLKDFAQHSPKTSVTAIKANKDGTEDIAIVVANALPARIDSVSLEDRSPFDDGGNVKTGKGDGDHDLRKSEEGFTNYEIINVAVDSPVVNDANRNYSVRKITLSGAKFISDVYNGSDAHTVVQVNEVLLNASSDYKFTDDYTCVEFVKAFDSETQFQFFNVLLDTTDDGEKTVSATAYSPAGVSYSAMSTEDKKIILDKTPPALADEGPFAYGYENSGNYEYPRQKNDIDYETYGLSAKALGLATYGSMAGNTGKEIRFFYTSKYDRRLPVKVEDTNSLSPDCLQIKVVDSIEAGKATSQGVLGATGYAYSTNPVADFSTGRLGYTPEDVGYYRYESKDWSISLNPYTYVAADRAGNVSEPHQFYVIKDNKSPSITVDGTDYGKAPDSERKQKSLTNLMELVIPDGKQVFRNEVENTASEIYDATAFDFWNDKDGHNTKSLSSYQYVLAGGENGERYKIKINLKSGVSSGTMLIGGPSASKVDSYSQRLPTPGDSGLAKWAITHYYKKWNSTATESNWDAAWPVGTLGAAFFDSRVTWNDYDGEDIVYEIPDSSKGVPPLTLLLMDNCANIYQIPIRPTSMDAAMTTHSEDNYPCHSGESVSWIFDKKLPEPVAWSASIENNLNDQFIIFAGGCDNRAYNKDSPNPLDIADCKNISEGNTRYAVGWNRLGALYLDNKTQYYNHNVYLQLLMNSEEPIRWADQEVCTNNVQPLYENGSQPPDFTLRARVLFREGTDANEPPEESDFAGMSSASLTKWSYFKQKSTDGKRLWNILMPHGDEGKLGTLWLYLEDYVGNKGIYQVKNGGDVDIKNGSDVDKFVWNDEPPKVAIVGDDFPTNAKSVSNSDFSTFGSYRYYEHLAFTEYSGEEFAQKMQKLVPPSKYGAHKDNELNAGTETVKKYAARLKDSDYTGLYSNLDDLDLYRVYTDESNGTTYYGNHVIKQRSGNEYIENAIKGLASTNDEYNTYTYDSMLSNFNIKVSTVSGITGYKYWTSADDNSYETQSIQAGDNLEGKWFVRSKGGDSDSKRVNTTVPYQFKIENKPLYLYIYDKVGNISITKLGNKWTHDMGHPATSDNTWTSGKANPGESYVKQPGDKWIVDATIAGAGEKFAAAKESNSPFEIKIPASWYNDTIAKERDTDYMASSKGSGIYGAGILPNVIGAATPVDADGNLTIKIPAKVYLEAMDNKGTSLMYFSIYDRTGNYWDCHLNVKVDASAPTMRVGVTRLNDSSTFHSVDNLYTKVYGKGAVPTDKTPDTDATADDRLDNQGNALKTFTIGEGYSKNKYENLYSLASNVSKQYSSKSDVDDAYINGTADEKSRFFKIQCNNHSFFVNAWADDDGGISQVSIRKWDKTSGVWSTNTAMGDKALEFNNGDSSVTSMSFETNPPSPYILSGKPVDSDESKRYAIYVTTESQTEENLYEVSATDFAGNAVFYYAYILPYDNVGPTVTEATVTGNVGSSVYNSKFYYNDLTYSLSGISDERSGLGAYSYGYKKSDSVVETRDFSVLEGITTVSNLPVTAASTENAGAAFVAFVQDILGNKREITSFKVNGGTEMSSSAFVYDSEAPSVSFADANFKRTGKYWISGDEFDDTDGSKTTKDYLKYNSTAKTLYVLSCDYDSTIVITPTGDDYNGVQGFIVTDTDEQPVFNTALISDSFTFNAGKGMTNSFADKTVSLADTTGLNLYFWAVDRAGNISSSNKLSIKYYATNPSISAGAVDGSIEVRNDDTKGRIYQDGTANYYSKSAYVDVTVSYVEGYEPKGWKILKSESSSNSRDNQLAWKNFVSSDYEQLDGNLRKYKIYLPALDDARNNGDDFYISFYSNSDSPTYRLVFADKQKWYYDNNVPSAPANPVFDSRSTGLYVKETGGSKTLYFRDNTSEGKVSFTVTDNTGKVNSGVAGVLYAVGSVPSASESNVPASEITLKNLSAGTLNVYAFDNVWNRSASGYSMTVVKDDANPSITAITPTLNDYVYNDTVNNCIWFNGSDLSAKVPSVSLAVAASDTGSGIKSYTWTSDVTGVTVTEASAGTYTVSGFDKITDSCTLTLIVKDNVGNESTPYTVELKKDSDVPTGFAIDSIGGLSAEDEARYVYADSLNADWKTVSGKTVYVNGNLSLADKDAIFTYAGALADTGSGLKEGSPSASKDPVTDNKWIVTASDNVGNETTYTVTLIADGDAPAPDSTYYTTENTLSSLSGASVNLLKNKEDEQTTPYGLTSGSAYLAYDSAVGDDYATVIYTSAAKCNIPSATDGGAGAIQYALKYGNTSDVYSTAPTSWTDMPSSGNAFEVDLPDEAVVHGYLFIWFKDGVGNTSAFQMGNPDTINIPQKSGYNWMACQKSISENNISAAYGNSDNTLVISGIGAGSSVKSISITFNADASVNDGYVGSVEFKGLGKDGVEKNYTPSNAKSVNDKTIILDFSDKPRLANGSISIKFNNPVEIASVLLKDKNDNSKEINSIGTRSLISRMTSSVSGMFSSIFGRIAGDKETRALKAAERADKKAARQAEIAAAREAKKMAKLLAKQQKEEARRLKESLAVQNADIGALESKSVSAGTETAALADQDVEFEARSSGIDQWNKSAVAAIKRGNSGKKNGSFPVIPLAAGAVVLCACGAGVFIYRKKKSL
nr:Ig-like domain-containing protein [uncultured Treponema sp.]